MISPLKRPTTIPTARRSPLGEPSITPTPSGRRSLPIAWSGVREAVAHASSPGGSKRCSWWWSRCPSLSRFVSRYCRFSMLGGTSIGTCSTTLEAEALDAGDLARVVREDADRREPELGEDLGADAVLPRVGREAELDVRLDRVEPVLLELVGLQLRQEPDAAPLLGHVEQDAALLGGDPAERELELLAAVAAERVEDVAGEALRVDADEHVLLAVHLAPDERDVVLAGQHLAERDRRELAVGRREAHRRHPLDQLLGAAPVLDQVLDRDHLDPVPLAVRDQVGHARHRPVLVHDLADDAGGVQARQAREVDRRLGLAGALQHAAGAGAEREDVAGLDEVVRALRRVDRHLDRVRAVGRGDPGRDALARLDRDRERRLVRRLVVVRHRLEVELVAALLGQAEADEPAAVHRHEVDRLGRGELRSDRQVALVLAVGSVDDDHELPLADVLDRLVDRGEGRRRLHLQRSSPPGIVSRWVAQRLPEERRDVEDDPVAAVDLARNRADGRRSARRSARPRSCASTEPTTRPAGSTSGCPRPVRWTQHGGAVPGLDRAVQVGEPRPGPAPPRAVRGPEAPGQPPLARGPPRAGARSSRAAVPLAVAEGDAVERARASPRPTSRSTCLAITSTSRFTSSPSATAPSVVAARVCGISATPNASSPRLAIVRLTPSTVIGALLDAVAQDLRRRLDLQALLVGAARTRPTPSTWPWTRWPPSGSPARSAGSTFTAAPASRRPSELRRSVSGTTSKSSAAVRRRRPPSGTRR